VTDDPIVGPLGRAWSSDTLGLNLAIAAPITMLGVFSFFNLLLAW
jgi:hypothetical protein